MVSKSFILIPFGIEFLALSQEAFREALELGRQVAGIENIAKDTKPIEKLLDADEAGEITGIPPSWFLETARQGKIPHIRAGKYVRFRMSDVIQALEIRPGQEANITPARFKAI